MGMERSYAVGSVLDRMAREKEISALFFARMAETLPDPEQRSWFRRMGQDEKDQRKILLKHRRELCGPRNGSPAPEVNGVFKVLLTKSGDVLFEEALRLAIRTAEETRDLCVRASDVTPDRSCRIFLKILSQESEVHCRQLLKALRKAERERTESVEEIAA